MWWLHDQLRHILLSRRLFLSPSRLHAYSSHYTAVKPEKENGVDVSVHNQQDLMGLITRRLRKAYIYKLQILKRHVRSLTSPRCACLVGANTSTALVSLVSQALPQTVMELSPLLPVCKEAKQIVKQPRQQPERMTYLRP